MPNIQLQFRRDYAATWTSLNPILASGEMGIEIDTTPYVFKIGDGVTRWRLLPYGGLAGVPGTTGATGAPGTLGYTGDTGATGRAGTTGWTGATGVTGATGQPGQAGQAGTTGWTGATGATGIPGSATNTGATGATGLAGTTGWTGATGIKGDTGTAGAAGSPGGAGAAGATGATGAAGATGATGAPGTAGQAGQTGATGQVGSTGYTGSKGDTGPAGTGGGGGTIGLLSVPGATVNFNFSTAVSTLPTSFGTFNAGGADASTFTVTLNAKYTATNLPIYTLTGYVYSSTAGYINVQRQFGVQTGTAAAGVTVNGGVTTLTFTNVTKTNFPYTTNDANGYAMYIAFVILN